MLLYLLLHYQLPVGDQGIVTPVDISIVSDGDFLHSQPSEGVHRLHEYHRMLPAELLEVFSCILPQIQPVPADILVEAFQELALVLEQIVFVAVVEKTRQRNVVVDCHVCCALCSILVHEAVTPILLIADTVPEDAQRHICQYKNGRFSRFFVDVSGEADHLLDAGALHSLEKQIQSAEYAHMLQSFSAFL